MDASSIIRLLGGDRAVAQALGRKRSAVSNWSRRGIPGQYWPALARLAARRNGSEVITLDILEHHTRVSPGTNNANNAPGRDSDPIKSMLAA